MKENKKERRKKTKQNKTKKKEEKRRKKKKKEKKRKERILPSKCFLSFTAGIKNKLHPVKVCEADFTCYSPDITF